MQSVTHLVHAYKIAPWRAQRQWIGGFLLAVVVLTMIASLYLDVSAQAAIAGREIQDLTSAITTTKQASADLQARLASLTASTVMEQQAIALGFEPVGPEKVEYLLVPGFSRPEPDILTSAVLPQLSAPSIPPEYTQSLLEWFAGRFIASYVQGSYP
ncbi:MAG: hypothetical protein A2Y54_05150 [Chloroflexi bacterium RBG_16_51_16]|nr:MAG: hypothetical protein A2Y54_05150 [Chloroflexi bacterium RBG_16_51_16]